MKRTRAQLGLGVVVGTISLAMLGPGCAEGSTTDEDVVTSSKDASTNTNGSTTGTGADSGEIPFGTGIDASTPEDGSTSTTTGDGGPVDTCYDPKDVGGTEGLAKGLPDRTDCDGSQKAEGISNGAVDVDVFKFHGQDKFSVTGSCTTHAKADVQAKALEVCMFVQCDNKDVDFQGCKSGNEKTFGAMKGCCAATPATVEIDYTCNGSANDSATFYLRVSGSKDLCVPYTINYEM